MKTTDELLSRTIDGYTDPFGPKTHSIISALVSLREAPLYSRCGEPTDRDDVVRVATPGEAMTIVSDDDQLRYEVNGQLIAPGVVLDEQFSIEIGGILDDPVVEDTWWQRARTEATRIQPVVFCWNHLDPEAADFIRLCRWEFPSRLIAEILVSDRVDCTYFRDQLVWYCAGHFPCGWEGDWPAGRMRVY